VCILLLAACTTEWRRDPTHHRTRRVYKENRAVTDGTDDKQAVPRDCVATNNRDRLNGSGDPQEMKGLTL
jgi:ribosomal protein L15E